MADDMERIPLDPDNETGYQRGKSTLADQQDADSASLDFFDDGTTRRKRRGTCPHDPRHLMDKVVPKERNKRIICIAVTSVLTLAITILLILWAAGVFAPRPPPRNVIFMISDGMGPTSVVMARESRGNEPLAFEKLHIGLARTYSSDSLVTDSAAGATAYSCGLKSYNGAIGVDPDRKPCGTLLEAAKLQRGMKTGMVVTSTISHATPGSFAAHAVWRSMEDFIAEQEIDLGVDVLLGGGMSHFTKRADGRDLLKKASDAGYTVVTDTAGLKGIKTKTNASLPLLGLFAPEHMDFEIDRDPAVQPSLAEMTQTAIDLLSAGSEEGKQNEEGFFLLIEGSRIDMAAHLWDPAAQIHDVYAYEAAFEVAYKFAQDHGNTLIVMTSDHETGGLTLGRNLPKSDEYPNYSWWPTNITRNLRSADRAATRLMSNTTLCCVPNSTTPLVSQQALQDAVRDEAWNSFRIPTNDWQTDDLDVIVAALTTAWQSKQNWQFETLIRKLADAISVRAEIGWTTYGHTGTDVNMYALFPEPLIDGKSTNSPGEAPWELFGGVQQNTDLGAYVSKMFSLNLKKVTDEISSFNPGAGSSSARRSDEAKFAETPDRFHR